ncbi:unnamed protein product [Allacma fusca]|uniref:Uncharacterized protein n=1 Tax=Allacma fusca TaxID=39272 RepID=A0A8J2J6Y9_9HEXA|nr:unnamed protein product [Allacma fusca]
MAKQNKPEYNLIPGETPAYFPPIVAQPMEVAINSESYPLSNVQTSEMSETSLALVTPAVRQNDQNQDAFSGQHNHPAYARIDLGLPNLIDSVLADEEKLSFRSNRKIACGAGSFTVQIRGNRNELIMSTVTTTSQMTTGYVSDVKEPRSTIVMFNDPTGENLMVCKELRDVITVTAGDRLIGLTKGVGLSLCCSCRGSPIYSERSSGDLYFETERWDSEFNFVRNGTILATARRGGVNGDDFGVTFAASLDSDTKAMLTAVSYYVYLFYYADTTCGCSGVLASNRIIFVVLMIFFVLIVGAIGVASVFAILKRRGH